MAIVFEVCNRCLVVFDARIEYVAQWSDQQRTLSPSSPAKIATWYERIMEASGGDATFSYGPTTSVLTPVSTWHGDLVCSPHLWDALDRERRRR